jgi:hypothetical protein
MADMVDVLVDFMILILSAVIGFGVYYATNTTGWDATVITLWGYIPLVFIFVGIVALVIKVKYIGH